MLQGYETERAHLSRTGYNDAESLLCAPSPGLPEGVRRDACLEAVIEVRRLSLTPATERVLRFYVRHTRPSDWSEPGRGPVAFVAQGRVAEALGISRRSVYRAECDLERLGLATKLSADNGRRYGQQRSDDMVCGIYFAPMIAAYGQFISEAATMTAARSRLQAMRKLASSLRFRVRRLAKAAGDAPQATAALAALDHLPSRIMELTELKKLSDIIACLAPFAEALDALGIAPANDLPASHKPVENKHKLPKMSHTPDKNVLRHINTTNKTSYESCNQGQNIRTASYETEEKSKLTSAYADELLVKKHVEEARCVNPLNTRDCRNSEIKLGKNPETNVIKTHAVTKVRNRAQKDEKQLGLLRNLAHTPDPVTPYKSKKNVRKVAWTLAQLTQAASVEFRALCQGENTPVSQQCLINAAETICHILGINKDAWAEACSVMGRNEAALAVLVIDKNQNHPTHPILCPGGTLRAMTQKAKNGELNLDASIFAIIKRNTKSPNTSYLMPRRNPTRNDTKSKKW